MPPRSTAGLGIDMETNRTQRNRHLQSIAEHGRMGCQKRSGYNRRTLRMEASISRFKRVSRDARRSRTDHRRAMEIAIAVQALTSMLELGCPKSIRIVQPKPQRGLSALASRSMQHGQFREHRSLWGSYRMPLASGLGSRSCIINCKLFPRVHLHRNGMTGWLKC